MIEDILLCIGCLGVNIVRNVMVAIVIGGIGVLILICMSWNKVVNEHTCERDPYANICLFDE